MKYYSQTSSGFKVKDFSIKHTVESAQPLTFYADYDLDNGLIEYPSGRNFVKVAAKAKGTRTSVMLKSSNMAAAKRDFAGRFGLKDDMDEIYSRIDTDSFVHEAIERYHGMRVTVNDPWETTLCFIISQYNNVKRIRLIVKNFVKAFGTDIYDQNGKVIGRSFPTSEELMGFGESDFRKQGAGFRAKYIASAAEYCTNSLDLYKLSAKNYDNLKEELMEIDGVGDKVADCIALMGYGSMDAFPIDVWVKRTLERMYFKGRKRTIKQLHRFAEKRWDGYRGYAQQYIFHTGRNI